MYAQMVTPGYVIILTAGNVKYLYTASDLKLHYGGPLDSWKYSALYVEPTPNDPNLNGSLIQVSLAGTNPTDLLDGVSSFWPQADGSILANRRTSRSGFDLLYLAPGHQRDATVIAGGFDIVDGVVNKDGTQWAAFKRTMLGVSWEFVMGKLDGDPQQAVAVPLPTAGKPVAIYWQQDQDLPVVALLNQQYPSYYQLIGGDKPGWQELKNFYPPERLRMSLNKSEMLVAKTAQVEGKPVTRVYKQWFTGDEKPVALIANFKMYDLDISPDHRFLLLSGRGQDDRQMSVTVDVGIGEVLKTVPESQSSAKLFLFPPKAWLAGELEKLGR
jgi:hypothetical protein